MAQDLKVVELELGFECKAQSREGGVGRAFRGKRTARVQI